MAPLRVKRSLALTHQRRARGCGRAGSNEREAPGKVMTASPSKRLAQQRSVSHADQQ